VEELAANAKKVFADLGFDRVHARLGSGYLGWPEEAPFDAIVVTAAPESVPADLVDQLRDGGRMIAPVGKAGTVQSLRLITKTGGRITDTELLLVRFVPMVG